MFVDVVSAVTLLMEQAKLSSAEDELTNAVTVLQKANETLLSDKNDDNDVSIP